MGKATLEMLQIPWRSCEIQILVQWVWVGPDSLHSQQTPQHRGATGPEPTVSSWGAARVRPPHSQSD